MTKIGAEPLYFVNAQFYFLMLHTVQDCYAGIFYVHFTMLQMLKYFCASFFKSLSDFYLCLFETCFWSTERYLFLSFYAERKLRKNAIKQVNLVKTGKVKCYLLPFFHFLSNKMMILSFSSKKYSESN